MSDTTKRALDEALAQHIADEHEGAIVTGYVLQAAYMSGRTIDDGSTGYLAEFADGQPFHVGLGLAHQLVAGYQPTWVDGDDE